MSNLKIFVRIKPSVNNIDTCIESDNNNIIIDKRQKTYANTCIVKCKYIFDKIFDDSFLNSYISNNHLPSSTKIRSPFFTSLGKSV